MKINLPFANKARELSSKGEKETAKRQKLLLYEDVFNKIDYDVSMGYRQFSLNVPRRCFNYKGSNMGMDIIDSSLFKEEYKDLVKDLLDKGYSLRISTADTGPGTRKSWYMSVSWAQEKEPRT